MVATVPIGSLEALARLESVVYVQASRPLRPANDVSVPETGATQARTDYGVSGGGVVVGYIDSGIDFTHDDFRNADGSTRVEYLLDLSDPGDLNSDGTLDGPDDFGGTLYTESEINAALADNGEVFASTDTPLDIPDNDADGVSSDIEIAGDLTINTFAMDIEILHSRIGDLRVQLISPQGTTFWLHDRGGGERASIIGTFETNRFDSEAAAGTWTLVVSDHARSYSGDLIYWALRINQAVREEDNVGHGTHGAGTAAGNGRGSAGAGTGSAAVSGPYTGMAPEADLIVVKASRTDGGGYSSSDLINALSFIDAKAGELGQPFVANLSLGGHLGAHDGSSLEEQAIDSLVGPGIPGKAVVIAAGNEGDEDIHASGTVRSGSRTTVGVKVPSSRYVAVVDVWYPGSDEFGVGFANPSGVGVVDTGLRPGQDSCWSYSTTIFGIRIQLYAACVISEPNSSLNGDKEIQLLLVGLFSSIASGEWKLYLHPRSVHNGSRFDAWALGAEFSDPDPSMRVGMPGTARNAMTVGAYVTKDQWVDASGMDRSCGDYPEYLGCCPAVGEIACFSSDGPTRDGRQKPEITAPGQLIASAYSEHAQVGSRFSMFPTDEWVVQTGSGYALAPGTSFAAPHVSGAVALIMETDPSLDAVEIRELLTRTARADSFTGTSAHNAWDYGQLDLPDSTWGYGKLDVHAAISQAYAPRVTAIDPDHACVDIAADVTITGANFEATPSVTIDSTPLTNVTYVSSTMLTATVPEGIAPGTHDVTVVNPRAGHPSGTLSDGFTIIGPPTVTAISPDRQCVGAAAMEVTVTGTDFEPTSLVTIGSTSLLGVTYVNSTTLTATVPEGMLAGLYDVTVTNPGPCDLTATLSEGFSVIGTTTLTAISPSMGSNTTATRVSITGSGFSPTPTVMVGSTALIDVAYVSPTSLTAIVPAGLAVGTYDVTVTNPEPCPFSASLPSGFTAIELVYIYLPIIIR
jgi:subtilisin family serine protease